ncbi:Ig-like domain-containing protein [Geoalkalibacter sp.]|uniref:Ig-like domain-containing protein n=1 Tax=Geoalkalibacter sp. TaxID=3041440 RepID=UPI00272EBCBC|nr:Ig-like domain-containing protein [Geoalkalibacter sp.]
MRLFIGVALLLAVATLSGCGASDDPSRPNTFTPLTALEISAPLARIAQGTSTPLSALGNFSGLFTRDISTEVFWESLDPQVATVSNSAPTQGRVTGVAPGTATIRAALDDVEATFQIEVSDALVAAIALTPTAPSIAQGRELQLNAMGTFSDASSQDLTFDAAWSSAAPSIATVGDGAADKGLLRGLSPGTSTITASFGGLSAAVTATVTAAALQGLQISPRNATLANLTLFPFRAEGTFSNGTTQDVTADVVWSTGNTTLARVDNGVGRKGEVRALLPGVTRISADLNGINASTSLTIIGATPSALSLSPVNATLALDTSLPFSARATLANGTQRDVTELVTWASSSTAVADISNLSGQNGLLTAKAQGITQVRATLENLPEVSTSLVVGNLLLQGIGITPAAPPDLPVGTSLALTANGTFFDAFSQNLTRDVAWSSANQAIATVETSGPRTGRVKALAVGNTSIRAVFRGVEVSIPISVINPALANLAISPAAARRGVGTSLDFSATGVFVGGISRVITEDVDWSSSNEEIVSFRNSAGKRGRATLLSRGTTTIRAQFGDTEITTTLIVD